MFDLLLFLLGLLTDGGDVAELTSGIEADPVG